MIVTWKLKGVPHLHKTGSKLKYLFAHSLFILAGTTRLELAISGLTGQCVNQLHHAPTAIISYILNYVWWAEQGSNLRPPACKADALPAELPAHSLNNCNNNTI